MVAFTCVDPFTVAKVAPKLEALGAKVLMLHRVNVDLTRLQVVTHLVVGTPVRRTTKLMAAIPVVPNIMDMRWVEDCLQSGTLQLATPPHHTLQGAHMVGLDRAKQVCWNPAVAGAHRCLSDVEFVVPLSMSRTKAPKPTHLRAIVEHNGGRVRYRLPRGGWGGDGVTKRFVVTDTRGKAAALRKRHMRGASQLKVYDVRLVLDAVIQQMVPEGPALQPYGL